MPFDSVGRQSFDLPSFQFHCLNSASTAGENRKATLDHDGQARQPDIVGRTEEGHEAYYGELKGMRLSTVSPNLDCSIKRFFQDVPDSVISPDYNHALQAKATGAYVRQQSIPDTGHTSSKRGTWYSLQGEGG
jgi:hypothetical protein